MANDLVSDPIILHINDYFEDADLDRIYWSYNSSKELSFDQSFDFSEWDSSRNDATYTTIYNKTFGVTDNITTSDVSISLFVHLEDALTSPVILDINGTAIDSIKTIISENVGDYTLSVNKSGATFHIVDDVMRIKNNALGFRSTAQTFEDSYNINAIARYTANNGVIEESSSQTYTIVAINPVQIRKSTFRIRDRGLYPISYDEIFSSSYITILDPFPSNINPVDISYSNANREIYLPDYTFDNGISSIDLLVDQGNLYNSGNLVFSLTMTFDYSLPEPEPEPDLTRVRQTQQWAEPDWTDLGNQTDLNPGKT